jgi:Thiol:disulfide interchange protein DsbD, N-terminal
MRTAVFVVLLSTTLAAQSTPTLGFRGQKRPLHATVTVGPDNLGVMPGTRAMLFIDVTPNPNIHVYAPGAKEYIPITVKFEPQVNVKMGKLTYPKSELVTLLDEKVPVFQKPFRLMQEVTVLGALSGGATVPVKGTVEWQACDDKVCYPPESAEVSWTLNVK